MFHCWTSACFVHWPGTRCQSQYVHVQEFVNITLLRMQWINIHLLVHSAVNKFRCNIIQIRVMIQYLVPFYQNFLIKYMYKVLHSRFVLSWLHLSSKGLAIASSMNFSFPRYHQQCIITGIVLTCMCYVWYAIYRFCILWSLNELCLKINLSSLLHTDGSWGQWLGIECLIYRLGLSLYRFIWWDVRYIYIHVLHTYMFIYIYILERFMHLQADLCNL